MESPPERTPVLRHRYRNDLHSLPQSANGASTPKSIPHRYAGAEARAKAGQIVPCAGVRTFCNADTQHLKTAVPRRLRDVSKH